MTAPTRNQLLPPAMTEGRPRSLVGSLSAWAAGKRSVAAARQDLLGRTGRRRRAPLRRTVEYALRPGRLSRAGDGGRGARLRRPSRWLGSLLPGVRLHALHGPGRQLVIVEIEHEPEHEQQEHQQYHRHGRPGARIVGNPVDNRSAFGFPLSLMNFRHIVPPPLARRPAARLWRAGSQMTPASCTCRRPPDGAVSRKADTGTLSWRHLAAGAPQASCRP